MPCLYNCQIISDSFCTVHVEKKLDEYNFFANIIGVKTRLKLVSLLEKIPQHISIFYTWSINLENNSLVFSAYTRAFVTWKVDLRTFIPYFLTRFTSKNDHISIFEVKISGLSCLLLEFLKWHISILFWYCFLSYPPSSFLKSYFILWTSHCGPLFNANEPRALILGKIFQKNGDHNLFLKNAPILRFSGPF